MKIINRHRNNLPTVLASLALIASIGAMGMAVYNANEINNQNKNIDLGSLADVDPGLVYSSPETNPYSLDTNPNISAKVMSDEEFAAINEKDFERLGTINYGPDSEVSTSLTPDFTAGLGTSSRDSTAIGTSSASVEDLKVSVNELFNLAPNIVLNDVSGVGALGKASMALYNNQTYFRLAAINLPSLGLDERYEAWLINEIAQTAPFSIGVLNYVASTSQATLFSSVAGDMTDHNTIAITIEKSSIEPKFAPQILKSSFPVGADFAITNSDIIKNRDLPTLSPANPVNDALNPNNPEQKQLKELKLPNKNPESSSLDANSLSQVLGNDSSLEDLIKALKSRNSGTGVETASDNLSLDLSDLFTPGSEASQNNTPELLKNLLNKNLNE